MNDYYTFAYIFGLWDLKWVNTLLVGSQTPYAIMSVDNESLMSTVYAPDQEHFYVCWRLDPTCESPAYDDIKFIQHSSDLKSLAFTLKKEEIPNFLPQLKRFFIHDSSIQALESEEAKEQVIIKRMVSFLWGKKSVPCYIGKKGLWLQLYADIPNIPSPQPYIHTNLLDPLTRENLQALTIPRLKSLFQDFDENKPILPIKHYQYMIARSQLVLKGLHETNTSQQ